MVAVAAVTSTVLAPPVMLRPVRLWLWAPLAAVNWVYVPPPSDRPPAGLSRFETPSLFAGVGLPFRKMPEFSTTIPEVLASDPATAATLRVPPETRVRPE